MDGDSSVLSSVTTLSAHGTRDLREVVEEIQDEFVTTSNFGKEVALLLEVCKRPYRSRVAALRGSEGDVDWLICSLWDFDCFAC
ncbi:hypothetical protein JHK87_047202 [Glycine soja]|nr:hypothetical protein JHK87_047202 [Glycine soja]